MSAILGNQELLAKLGKIASGLGLAFAATVSVTTVSPQSGAQWELAPSYAVGSAAGSSTTTLQADALPLSRTLSLAIAEVRIARRVLNVSELAEDDAFLPYVIAVNQALDAYDSAREATYPEAEAQSMGALAANLAVARAVLEGRVSKLSFWSALASATQPKERYVPVPRRFQNVENISLSDGAEPTAAEVEAWMDLDVVDFA